MLNTQLYCVLPGQRYCQSWWAKTQSRPTVSISLRAVYFDILQRRRLNYPCRLTDITDKSWMSQHQNVCVSVDVCICLMSLAGSLGPCRSEQVSPGWGERMKKTLKESGGLIWTALLCSGTLTRLLSDKSKTHSAPPSEVGSTWKQLKHSGLSLLLLLVQLQEWIIVRLLKSDLILWGFSAVLLRPASIWGGFTWEDLSKPDPVGASVCVCVYVWEREHTLS